MFTDPPNDNEKSFLGQYNEDAIKRMAEAISVTKKDFENAFLGMVEGARRLNQVFGQSRQRITELAGTIRDAAPVISNLGGNIQDTFTVLEEIAKATEKNYAASSKEASALYSANLLLGTSAQDITEKFTEAGIQVSRIGPELLKGIVSVQNLGLNTKQIFYDVQRNMDALSKYNFSEGVNGLAKMAATASVFKFDMSETFRVADKALSPDGAIELSSAFQRMGVAVGQLTDPFQLMNMSLNDPQGLQKSLSQMTKQYAEFDEKTKTFKINPAGMLQMRELSQQTGIAYDQLSKSALAAANFDRVLSSMKPEITFKNEEDKMLLANIAKMDESGDYTVSIKDDKGVDKQVKVSELTNEQLSELLKQQKAAPKTIEEIAKKQLDYAQDAAGSLKSIADAFTYGVSSPSQLLNITESMKEFSRETLSKVQKAFPESSDISGKTTKVIDTMVSTIGDLYKQYQSGTLTKDVLLNKVKELEDKTIQTGKEFGTKAVDLVKEVSQDFKTRFIENNAFKSTRVYSDKTKSAVVNDYKGGVEFKGEVTFKVDAPPGVNKNELESYINSREFKEKVYTLVHEMRKEKGLEK